MKVYILYVSSGIPHHEKFINGVITNSAILDRWKNLGDYDNQHLFIEAQLDDPELLNRIAKESEMKK